MDQDCLKASESWKETNDPLSPTHNPKVPHQRVMRFINMEECLEKGCQAALPSQWEERREEARTALTPTAPAPAETRCWEHILPPRG